MNNLLKMLLGLGMCIRFEKIYLSEANVMPFFRADHKSLLIRRVTISLNYFRKSCQKAVWPEQLRVQLRRQTRTDMSRLVAFPIYMHNLKTSENPT